MRVWGTIGVLLLCLALVGSIACNPFEGDSQEEVSQQVERGDLIISVSGSGNIEVSNEAELVFGVGGRIDKIYVEEGDNVTEGDALAKLDTSTLELALTQAQVAVTQQQLAIIQAEVALDQAEYNLDQARDLYTWPEIKIAQSDVDEAEAYVDYLSDSGLSGLSGATLAYAQARLAAAEAKLDAMIMSYDTEEVAIKKLQVEVAKQSLGLAQQSLEQAQRSVEQAQKQLTEAVITAPFSGLVASVPVDERDTVSTSATIVHLIDPTSMELKVQVDEIDVIEVKLGQRAIIEVDALPALPLEGKVSSISLLPTEEAGVIVYDVKIDFHVPEGIGLRAGMSATADIIIAERSNVLLVPDRAIRQDSQGNTVVEVVVNEQTEKRTVVIGISDGFQTEIVDGLDEGELVMRRAS